MTRRLQRLALTAGLAVTTIACQTTAQTSVYAAVALDDDDHIIREIKAVLEGIIHQGRISLGPSDLTRDSVIAVLPPPPGPYEGNSPAMPRYFELVTDGTNCFVRERGERTLHTLTGVRCRAK